MNADYVIYVTIVLIAMFIFELIIIYKAISDDLIKLSQKTMNLLAGKAPPSLLLEYKKPTPKMVDDPLAKHFQFKDIHSLEMIFDLPQSSIKDIEFTEDDMTSAARFSDHLTEAQKDKISYYSFSYTGYTEFLDLVEKKLKWKTGVRKVLVLTELSEKKITFSHYLAFEKSVLLDVIDSEIFWGVDVCVAVTHSEQLPAVKKEKVSSLFTKYDEIWIFEPTQASGQVLTALGLQDSNIDLKVEAEAYEQ